jgi:CheY-like chemotaxis protein
MPRARKILLADPDAETVHQLTRALRDKGYQISTAADGSRALEVAVLRHPDLILFDDACRLVQARTFLQILRTNPRTEDIPIVITGAADTERVRGARDGFLKKPFNLDDVLGRIAQIFRRLDAARELKGENREIEGSLAQMGIADLLQVLGQNKRTGTLALERGEVSGEIFLSQGKPVNARTGAIEGEKALFRLLTFQEGTFAFAPAASVGPTRIRRGMEEALLEGMRQADEIAKLKSRLPDPSVRLRLASDASILGDQHPVTAEVVRLLEQPRSLGDLLDLAAAPDLEVLAAVAALLDKGIAQVAPAADAPTSGPVLSPAEQHTLRARILRGRAGAKEVVGKAVLLADSQRVVRAFLARLSDMPGFRLLRQPTPELLGTWARIDFADGLRIELCSIPGAEEAMPLWRPFATGALGALALDRGSNTLKLGCYFAREVKVPLLLLGEGELPRLLKGVAGVVPAVGEPKQGIRALFEAVLHSPN